MDKNNALSSVRPLFSAAEYQVRLKEKVRRRSDLLWSEYPLAYQAGGYFLIKIKSKDIGPEDDILLLRAGIHGEESAGPLSILEHFEEIVDYAHKNRLKLIIFPLGNPSGFEKGTRYNIDGEQPNNDFVRYELPDGKLVDFVRTDREFKRWHWAIDKKIPLSRENELMAKVLRKEPLAQITACLDLHEDKITEAARPAFYQYGFGDLNCYGSILVQLKKIAPLYKSRFIKAGLPFKVKSDRKGFVVINDGTLGDLFFRLGARYSLTPEIVGALPLDKAIRAMLIWIKGIIDLARPPERPAVLDYRALCPKKITPLSRVHFIHTSSPVEKSDWQTFQKALAGLEKQFINFKIFPVKKSELDPRYLAASEKERLEKFRRARKKVDWLAPIYGGTGCVDLVRKLTEEDLAKIRKNRPVVNGFSDTTILVNYLYLKLKLIGFIYSNTCGLLEADNSRTFFDVIMGRRTELSFVDPASRWLGDKPKRKIEGIALGGTGSSFLEMINVLDMRVKTWKPYILFFEDIEVDLEDLHRVIVAMDEKGIFRNIRALVIGRIDDRKIAMNFRRLNRIFGDGQESPHAVFRYLLQPVITARAKAKDPLYILKISNFGHGVKKSPLLIPVGGRASISPDGRIDFPGPFVA